MGEPCGKGQTCEEVEGDETHSARTLKEDWYEGSYSYSYHDEYKEECMSFACEIDGESDEACCGPNSKTRCALPLDSTFPLPPPRFSLPAPTTIIPGCTLTVT